MFLTVGTVHQDQLWREWLDDAANVLPARAVATDTNKTIALLHTLTEDCGNDRWQALYSLYTHPKPSFNGFDDDSIFAGSAVEGRVEVRRRQSLLTTLQTISTYFQTNWGTFSLVDAFRVLLRSALQDSANSRFVLLSDSSIPLYPATLTWLQLTTERKSRADACTIPEDKEVCTLLHAVGLSSISIACICECLRSAS